MRKLITTLGLAGILSLASPGCASFIERHITYGNEEKPIVACQERVVQINGRGRFLRVGVSVDRTPKIKFNVPQGKTIYEAESISVRDLTLSDDTSGEDLRYDDCIKGDNAWLSRDVVVPSRELLRIDAYSASGRRLESRFYAPESPQVQAVLRNGSRVGKINISYQGKIIDSVKTKR